MPEKSISFTFLELHLGDGNVQLGPKSIDPGGDDEPADSIESVSELESEGGPSLGRLLVALAAVGLLIGIAVVVTKALGDDLGDATDLDDLAE